MREILFRGKRKDSGEWVFGMPWLFKDHACICPWKEGMCKYDTGFYPIHVNPETVGQFTGLTDKNGKKIFEGDVLLVADTDTAIVGYDETAAMFMAVFGYADADFTSLCNQYPDVVIVGNIHDNPELAEDKK